MPRRIFISLFFSRYFDIACFRCLIDCIRRLIGCVQTAIDSARPFVYDTGMHDERKPICAYEKYKDDRRYRYKYKYKYKCRYKYKYKCKCKYNGKHRYRKQRKGAAS